MSRYYFVVTLWGAEFRGYFLDLCLASLLAPDNVPALHSGGDDGRLLVCTTREDWEEMQKHATFRRAAEVLAPEFLELRMAPPEFLRPHLIERRRRQGLAVPTRNADWETITIQPGDVFGKAAVGELESIAEALHMPLPQHAEYNLRIMFMTWGHKLGAERAFRERCSVVFLGADMMFADGAIRELKRRVDAGQKVILVVTLRFDQDRCFEALRDAGLLSPGKPISIAPRDLVAMVFPHMHIETACFEFDSPWFCNRATSSLWRIPEDDGVVVYNLNYFPVLINFAGVHAHDMVAHMTIDGHYVDRNFDFNSDVHIIDDSDQFLYISFTKQSQYYYPVRKSWLKSMPILGRYYKISLLRRTLNGSMGNAAKRHIYPIPVIFHSKPVTPACRNLIARTRPIAQQAREPLRRIDHFFQALERGFDLDAIRRSVAEGRRQGAARALLAAARRRIARHLVNRGEAQTRIGRYRLAFVCYRLALRLTPDDVATWSRSFMARMRRGDFGGAQKDITTALSLSPHDLNLVAQHAEVAQFLEMWDAAAADYRLMLRARPDRADWRARQAGLYAAWGDCLARDAQPHLALERYATALQIAPDDCGMLARCANLKIGLGDCAGALADVNKALALAPGEANLLAQRVSLLAALKQQAAAAG
jgi:tetratricopeptide (TPR) repeat protein